MSTFHHLWHCWVLWLASLRSHYTHSLPDHYLLTYSIIVLSSSEQTFDFGRQRFFLRLSVRYSGMLFYIDLILYPTLEKIFTHLSQKRIFPSYNFQLLSKILMIFFLHSTKLEALLKIHKSHHQSKNGILDERTRSNMAID